ncbi:MAG: hypothetical protein OEV81_08035 [Betaproteobacteria bacterium]|nr:hypothetical protein [Betaproteobacteria bacterium]MDH5220180.1 hypothetical protein [Betaproteobacteria bacterium]MDH5351890.1 hypothetical protein [Betaproteobacteria bacterium]
MRTAIGLFIAALAAAGCAGKMPQTADEFRQMAPGAFMVQVQDFEVKRAVRDVGETFRRRAPECLNVTIRTTSSAPGSYQVIETAYKATVIAGASKAELHLQQKHLKGVIAVYEEPVDGRYLFVVDAVPAGARATKVQIIGPSRGYDVVVRAFKAWADGSSTACPDMTKIG